MHDNVLEILGELAGKLREGFDKLEGWTYKEKERPETSQQEGEWKSSQAE